MDDVARLVRSWWLYAIQGVVSLVCGILALVYPGITLLALGVILGFYLMTVGVVALLEAILGDATSRLLSAIVGVLALLAGLVCLRRPGASLLAIVVVVGFFLVISGIFGIVRAIADYEGRGLALLVALVDLVLGILILALPKLSLATLAVLVGISLIVHGAFSCVGAYKLWRLRGEEALPGSAAPVA
jgi:uncharacterized membrane protein HdeD (DUF308 family)